MFCGSDCCVGYSKSTEDLDKLRFVGKAVIGIRSQSPASPLVFELSLGSFSSLFDTFGEELSVQLCDKEGVPLKSGFLLYLEV